MTRSRAKLQILLNALEADLPAMLQESVAPARFWSAFARRASEIVDGAGSEDYDWAARKLDELLAFHGLARRRPKR